MKFMHIVSALSLAALVLGAPEAIPEEKRQGVWPLDWRPSIRYKLG
jgi:hypothetical protein